MAHNCALHMLPFDPDADVDVDASAAPKWKLCVSDFTTFLVARDITDPKRKCAFNGRQNSWNTMLLISIRYLPSPSPSPRREHGSTEDGRWLKAVAGTLRLYGHQA